MEEKHGRLEMIGIYLCCVNEICPRDGVGEKSLFQKVGRNFVISTERCSL